jgi:hypothetical protein
MYSLSAAKSCLPKYHPLLPEGDNEGGSRKMENATAPEYVHSEEDTELREVVMAFLEKHFESPNWSGGMRKDHKCCVSGSIDVLKST